MKQYFWILISLIVSVLVLNSCGDKDVVVTYMVSFNANGGTPVPPSQSVEEGKTATAPSTNPAKTGYVFLFWHLDGVSTAYNFSSPVNNNLSLIAKWEEEAKAEFWNITWELNGGTWPATGDNHVSQVVKNGTLAEPAAPTKTGKVFDGWYKEENLTNKIDFPYDVSAVTNHFTIYAKWVDPAPEYWQITWELGGGEWPSTGDNHVVKVVKGTTLTEPVAPIKSGSTFEGWYKEAELANKVVFPVTVTGDLKLYAKWGTFTDDPNLKKAAYCLAYIYDVTEKKKKGQNVSSISGVCSVTNWPNGTINYMSFSSYTALVPFLYNTPLVIGATSSSSRDNVYDARWELLDGTYDYDNDPAKIIALLGHYSGILFFPVNELGDKSIVGKTQIVANNNAITGDVLNKISYPSNSYKILIFGKNKAGALIGKYIGYTTNGTSFNYWRLDPDDPNFGKGTTISIPN